jgi:hypothetical protein
MKTLVLSFLAIAASSSFVNAQTASTVFSNNFGTGYTNGDLIGPAGTVSNTVGQNGWAQTGNFASGNPLAISNNQAVMPSGANGQDAWKAFDTVVNVTNDNYLVTTINFTLTNAANATGDYFFHLSSPAGTTSAFFQRLFSRSATGGFQLGINGASAAGSAAWGSTVLSLNTSYEVVIKWDFLSGTLNDILTVYVDPTDPILTNNTVYASTNFIVAEPTTISAANLRIGAATTTPGVLVDSIEVQLVPEPSTYALLALSAAGVAGYVVRRRRR